MLRNWTSEQPKQPGLYLRASYHGEVMGAYQMTGRKEDPHGPSLWLGPLPYPPSGPVSAGGEQ